jgi:hypothetical protein
MLHTSSGDLHSICFLRIILPVLIAFALQATRLRCDVIIGCEDGLLGCIMGCGIPRGFINDAVTEVSGAVTTHMVDFSEAKAAASAIVDRMVRVATSVARDTEDEETAQGAAAVSVQAISAAELRDAGVFRAVRVHNAAVLCVGVMTCAITV